MEQVSLAVTEHVDLSFDYITDNVCGFINFELLLYQDAEININRFV